MTETPDHPESCLPDGYKPVSTAPFVYFDFVPTYGTLSGSIQIELAARILAPLENGGVKSGMVEVARLRCSPTTAKVLRDTLESSLKMLEQPQSSPASIGTLN